MNTLVQLISCFAEVTADFERFCELQTRAAFNNNYKLSNKLELKMQDAP